MAKKTKHERLVDRVRKLYAMAQATDSSPHEAEIALKRCLSLMDKHGITGADLEVSAFDTLSVIDGAAADLDYIRMMTHVVASLHDCIAVFYQGQSVEIRGHDVDVIVAELTLGYLMAAMARSEAEQIAAGGIDCETMSKFHYRTGYVSSLQRRVNEILARREESQAAAAGDGKALVVQKLEAVRANCTEGIQNTIELDLNPQINCSSLVGMIDGQRVSLNQQIEPDDIEQDQMPVTNSIR